MALTYTGSTGLFTHLGKLIARVNSYNALAATTLASDISALLTAFGTLWLPEEGVAALYEQLRASVVGWRQAVSGFADSRLVDYLTVLQPLGLSQGAGLADVLPALVRRMVDDNQSVRACTVTAGSVAANAANYGNGTAFVTTLLDGFSGPCLDAPANVLYAGRRSEMAVPSETMLLECRADSATDGVTEGAEPFSWTGAADFGDLAYQDEGSGPGPGLTCAAGYGLLANGDFESWSGDAPTSWLLAGGVAGTDVAQDATLPYRGTSSLKVAGGGAPTVLLSQPISGGMAGRRRFGVALAVKASAAASGAVLRCGFTGTGYSAPAGDMLTLAGVSFPTGWTLYGFTVQVPAPTPADWSLAVQVDGLASGISLWLDNVVLAPVSYHGGVGAFVVPGSKPWLRGDRLTFAVANDGAGKFQTWFRRHYRTQLPSVVGPLAQPLALTLPMTLLGSVTADGSISDALVV